MTKVAVEEKVFDQKFDCFDKMEFKADEYVPTEKDMLIMLDDLPKYLPFLIWIDETGYDVEDDTGQKSMRDKIRKVVSYSMEMISD